MTRKLNKSKIMFVFLLGPKEIIEWMIFPLQLLLFQTIFFFFSFFFFSPSNTQNFAFNIFDHSTKTNLPIYFSIYVKSEQRFHWDRNWTIERKIFSNLSLWTFLLWCFSLCLTFLFVVICRKIVSRMKLKSSFSTACSSKHLACFFSSNERQNFNDNVRCSRELLNDTNQRENVPFQHRERRQRINNYCRSSRLTLINNSLPFEWCVTMFE